jgi:hypothetical protein
VQQPRRRPQRRCIGPDAAPDPQDARRARATTSVVQSASGKAGQNPQGRGPVMGPRNRSRRRRKSQPFMHPMARQSCAQSCVNRWPARRKARCVLARGGKCAEVSETGGRPHSVRIIEGIGNVKYLFGYRQTKAVAQLAAASTLGSVESGLGHRWTSHGPGARHDHLAGR